MLQNTICVDKNKYKKYQIISEFSDDNIRGVSWIVSRKRNHLYSKFVVSSTEVFSKSV